MISTISEHLRTICGSGSRRDRRAFHWHGTQPTDPIITSGRRRARSGSCWCSMRVVWRRRRWRCRPRRWTTSSRRPPRSRSSRHLPMSPSPGSRCTGANSSKVPPSRWSTSTRSARRSATRRHSVHRRPGLLASVGRLHGGQRAGAGPGDRRRGPRLPAADHDVARDRQRHGRRGSGRSRRTARCATRRRCSTVGSRVGCSTSACPDCSTTRAS